MLIYDRVMKETQAWHDLDRAASNSGKRWGIDGRSHTGPELIARNHRVAHHGSASRCAANYRSSAVTVMDRSESSRSAECCGERRLISARKPYSRCGSQFIDDGVIVRLSSGDVQDKRVSAQAIELRFLFGAGSHGVLCCHREDCYPRFATAAREIHEPFDKVRGLISASDDE
jgi:hypothetical protein